MSYNARQDMSSLSALSAGSLHAGQTLVDIVTLLSRRLVFDMLRCMHRKLYY